MLAGILSSCGLIYDDPMPCDDIPVTIVNDWRGAPDARPEGMAYLFYGEDCRQPWRFDFPGIAGGKVKLPEGSFCFVSFNDDTYDVRFDGDSYSSLKAFTWPAQLPCDVENGQKTVESPDMMWGCSYARVDISYSDISYVVSGDGALEDAVVVSPQKELVVRQRPITPRCHVVIEEVENLDGVVSMSGAMSGLSGSCFLASGVPGDYPVTMTFPVRAGGRAEITGEFSTFVLPATPDAANVLLLFVTLADGRQFVYRFDVTEQMRSASDPMDVWIHIRGLTIEKSDPKGGFNVRVDGWTTVDVNIND